MKRSLKIVSTAVGLVLGGAIGFYLVLPSLDRDPDGIVFDQFEQKSAGIIAPNVRNNTPAPSSDPFEELRQAIAKALKDVPARYNAPEKLQYGRSTEISFVLEPKGVGTGADLLRNLPGTVRTQNVRVSNDVRAYLTGPDGLVEIKPRGGEDVQRKAITLEETVQWVWDVKAVGEGTANLTLELLAYIDFEGGQKPLAISTFRQPIEIEISPIDRIGILFSGWRPVLEIIGGIGAIGGPLVALFGWWRRSTNRVRVQQFADSQEK
ncbi:hypothetical protein [Microvirga sp. Mcv34]|uniref:hypothetical protein n=1 Tax=Microvirga sp. Mcv34 TaxID=2926016 RepID=UPI0021C9173A|nr:hypothetical protein [Microvirga sp. Mcv34]